MLSQPLGNQALNQQYKANLGNTVVLNRANQLTDQYGQTGAVGNFTSVFDTPEDPSDTQLRNYNIVTWLGNYSLPEDIEDRALAILGRLTYGIGGASFDVDFDWKMGTQLSVAASFVRVSAVFSEFGTNTPQDVRIGAMLSSGSRAARSQVTRTFPRLVASSDDVRIFPIPPLAHALNIFANEPAFYGANNVQIRYLGGASAGFSTASTDLVSWVSDGAPFLQALAVEDGVRFPEAARFVEVTVLAEEATYHFTPCFTLSL